MRRISPRFARIQSEPAVKPPVPSKGGACICLLIPVRRKVWFIRTFRSPDASAPRAVHPLAQKRLFLSEIQGRSKICPFGALLRRISPRPARIQSEPAVKPPVPSKGGACICLLIPVRRKVWFIRTFRSPDASAPRAVHPLAQKRLFLSEIQGRPKICPFGVCIFPDHRRR